MLEVISIYSLISPFSSSTRQFLFNGHLSQFLQLQLLLGVGTCLEGFNLLDGLLFVAGSVVVFLFDKILKLCFEMSHASNVTISHAQAYRNFIYIYIYIYDFNNLK